MIKRICKKPGCNALIDKPKIYCEKHQPEQEKDRKDSLKWYRQNRDDDWEQNFYKNKRWLKRREDTLGRDYYLCRLCYSDKKITDADMVHHIVELKDDKELALDMENLISLCDCCHNKVHGKYRRSDIDKAAMQEILKNIIKR